MTLVAVQPATVTDPRGDDDDKGRVSKIVKVLLNRFQLRDRFRWMGKGENNFTLVRSGARSPTFLSRTYLCGRLQMANVPYRHLVLNACWLFHFNAYSRTVTIIFCFFIIMPDVDVCMTSRAYRPSAASDLVLYYSSQHTSVLT
jgi:hypothetical protein